MAMGNFLGSIGQMGMSAGMSGMFGGAAGAGAGGTDISNGQAIVNMFKRLGGQGMRY